MTPRAVCPGSALGTVGGIATWDVGLIFEEAGITGASRHDRPKLLELVARIDEWDVLLAFDFSRLARNQEDLGWIRNRLRLHRREAFEASAGLELGNIEARHGLRDGSPGCTDAADFDFAP